MFQKISHIFRQSEESDLLLCAAAESLFFGVYLLNLPASIILAGLMFAGFAYLSARQGAAYGLA